MKYRAKRLKQRKGEKKKARYREFLERDRARKTCRTVSHRVASCPVTREILIATDQSDEHFCFNQFRRANEFNWLVSISWRNKLPCRWPRISSYLHPTEAYGKWPRLCSTNIRASRCISLYRDTLNMHVAGRDATNEVEQSGRLPEERRYWRWFRILHSNRWKRRKSSADKQKIAYMRVTVAKLAARKRRRPRKRKSGSVTVASNVALDRPRLIQANVPIASILTLSRSTLKILAIWKSDCSVLGTFRLFNLTGLTFSTLIVIIE